MGKIGLNFQFIKIQISWTGNKWLHDQLINVHKIIIHNNLSWTFLQTKQRTGKYLWTTLNDIITNQVCVLNDGKSMPRAVSSHLVLSGYFGDLVLILKSTTFSHLQKIPIYNLYVGKMRVRVENSPGHSAWCIVICSWYCYQVHIHCWVIIEQASSHYPRRGSSHVSSIRRTSTLTICLFAHACLSIYIFDIMIPIPVPNFIQGDIHYSLNHIAPKYKTGSNLQPTIIDVFL